MSFEDILKKASGGRFSCLSQCCGCGYAKPRANNNGPEFDTASVVRLIAGSVLFAASLIAGRIPAPWPTVILIASALIAGYDILAGAVLACMRGSYFDRTVLISAAAIIAFLCGFASDAAALVLLFQIGDIVMDYAFARTRRIVLDDFSAAPVEARAERGGGEEHVEASAVSAGDIFLVSPGEMVVCDSVVLSGGGTLDCSAVGGPSQLVVGEGDEILSGSVSVDASLRCEAGASARDSAYAVLERAAVAAADRGDVVPDWLRKAVTMFTPILTIAAVLAAAVISLVFKVSAADAIHRGLMFLIVADPCSMLIASPLVYFCTIAGASRSGIVFSDCTAVMKTAGAGAVAFDKAGTLTDGSVKVTGIKSTSRIDPDTLLKITAHALAYSSNPLAKSVISAYGGTIYIELVQNFTETPDGAEVHVDGVPICAGKASFLSARGVAVPAGEIADGSAIYVSIANEYAGRIALSDGVRPQAAAGIDEIEKAGVGSVMMFTGENAASAAKSASELGIKEYYSSCDAARAAASLDDIRHSMPQGSALAFVHSSAMSAPAAADIDVLMGDVQSLSGGSAADVTLINGDVGSIASAVTRAKAAGQLSLSILGGAALVKLALLVLAFFGFSAAWFTVLVDGAAASGAVLASILAYKK